MFEIFPGFARSLLLPLLAALLQGLACAPVPAPAPTASAERFETAIERSRRAMASLAQEVPGAAAAVAAGGEVVWSEGFGLADLEARRRTDAATLFGIGSISKTLTVAAMMSLVDDGLLELDAPVERYLDDFPFPGRGVTLRRLAAHQSGLADDFATEHYQATEHFGVDAAYQRIKRGPLDYQPGSASVYATGVYTVLARLMEEVTGKPYLQVMEERVFAPAGMRDTVPNDPRREIPERTRFYVEEDGRPVPGPPYDPSFKLAGAGFLTTAGDLARFGAALLGPHLLSETARRQMFAPVPLASGEPTELALGLRVAEDGTLHQPGGGIGISAWLFLHPEEELAIAIVSNLTGAPVGGEAYREIMAAFREASTEQASGEPAAPGLRNGSFIADLGGVSIHYEVHGRGPVLMTLPNSWGLSLEGLRALYRPLEEHLTMVYFDPRGMGGSGAARDDSDLGKAAVRGDFDALRRHLGLGRVDVIGWSNGAMNLLLLASEKPETLRSALFVHGVARFTAEDGVAIAERYPDLNEIYGAFYREMADPELSAGERDERTKSFTVEEYFPYLFADRERGRRLLPELYRDTAFSWRHSKYAGEEGGGGFDATDRLAAITVPSLVIAGAHDLSPPERVEEIHRGIPDSRFVVFENSGHFAPVEEPERFVDTVLEFLGRQRR